MISFAILLLSFTNSLVSAAAAGVVAPVPAVAPAPMTPQEYGNQRGDAIRNHQAAMDLLDQREQQIVDAYGQRLQRANREMASEITRINERAADLDQIRLRAEPAVLALRTEAHGRFAAAGIFDPLPSADPAVAVAGPGIAPGVAAAALLQRNAADARLEAERFANQVAENERERRTLDATLLLLTQQYAHEYRGILEEIARTRATAATAHDTNLARLADLHNRWFAEQARVDAAAGVADADAHRVARQAAQQAAIDAALLALRA